MGASAVTERRIVDASEVAAKTCKLDDVVGHGWICRLRGFIGQQLVQQKYERIGPERSITLFKMPKGIASTAISAYSAACEREIWTTQIEQQRLLRRARP
jgi:hypothetical protein